jgi:hypothetical protein
MALSFYNIVLFVSIPILILLLAFIGMTMYYQPYHSNVHPQYLSECPDYWVKNDDGTCSVTIGSINAVKAKYDYKTDRTIRNIKVTPPSDLERQYYPDRLTYVYDFRQNGWCDNRKWAQTNDIVWDGVSNVKRTRKC